MTEPTTRIPATATMPVADEPPSVSDPGRTLDVERPRSHPLTYVALGLSALALVLSLAALGDDDGPEFREVRIGNNDCLIGDGGDEDRDVLYCRAANVP